MWGACCGRCDDGRSMWSPKPRPRLSSVRPTRLMSPTTASRDGRRARRDGTVAMVSLLGHLKPENGPVGAALGAWLDHARSGHATRFLVLWFVILWTAFHVVASASTGLNPDLVETYAWSLHPSAG